MHAEGAIKWQGTVQKGETVRVRFQSRAPEEDYQGAWLSNTAVVTDTRLGRGYPFVAHVRLRSAQAPGALYLPLVLKAR
jgi:hypothetical protein